ncbi:MAG: hypothetical protein ACFFEN_00295 [Candidatus Thorarchaeota archaeon]
MICDLLIIKDGLPLLSSNFTDSSNPNNIFTQEDNLIMISGFFSALDSFSDSFEDLGAISELKLSNNDLKLSFLRDARVPNLIYLASFDDKTEKKNVEDFLKRISKKFFQRYSIDEIENWNGRLTFFKPFEDDIRKYAEEEKKFYDENYNGKVVEWLKSFEDEADNELELIEEPEPVETTPEYYEYIPAITTSQKINPKHYLTGETSCMIYEKIDGKKTIIEITEELQIDPNKVYSICKNLIKMGIISFG